MDTKDKKENTIINPFKLLRNVFSKKPDELESSKTSNSTSLASSPERKSQNNLSQFFQSNSKNEAEKNDTHKLENNTNVSNNNTSNIIQSDKLIEKTAASIQLDNKTKNISKAEGQNPHVNTSEGNEISHSINGNSMQNELNKPSTTNMLNSSTRTNSKSLLSNQSGNFLKRHPRKFKIIYENEKDQESPITTNENPINVNSNSTSTSTKNSTSLKITLDTITTTTAVNPSNLDTQIKQDTPKRQSKQGTPKKKDKQDTPERQDKLNIPKTKQDIQIKQDSPIATTASNTNSQTKSSTPTRQDIQNIIITIPPPSNNPLVLSPSNTEQHNINNDHIIYQPSILNTPSEHTNQESSTHLSSIKANDNEIEPNMNNNTQDQNLNLENSEINQQIQPSPLLLLPQTQSEKDVNQEDIQSNSNKKTNENEVYISEFKTKNHDETTDLDSISTPCVIGEKPQHDNIETENNNNSNITNNNNNDNANNNNHHDILDQDKKSIEVTYEIEPPKLPSLHIEFENSSPERSIEIEGSIKTDDNYSNKTGYEKRNKFCYGYGKSLRNRMNNTFKPVELIISTPNLIKVEPIVSPYKPFFLDEKRYKTFENEETTGQATKEYTIEDFEDALDRLEHEYQKVMDKNSTVNYDLKHIFPITQSPELIENELDLTKVMEMSNLSCFFYEEKYNEAKNENNKDENMAIGSPVIISLFQNKYLIIGTSKGIVFIFNDEETILITLECKNFKKISVSALSFSEDFSIIAIGYENGGIAVFEVMTKTLLKCITDIHKTKIISLVIYQNDPISIISADISGELYKTELRQSIFISDYYSKESILLKKECDYITNMCIMNANMRSIYNTSKATFNEEEYLKSIIGIGSYNSVYIISIVQKSFNVLFTFNKPEYLQDKYHSMPSITWLYTSDSNQKTNFFIIAWGKVIHFIEFEYTARESIFNIVGHMILHKEIKYISALAKNVLAIMDTDNTIYITHYSKFKPGKFENFNNEYNYMDYNDMLRVKNLENYEIIPSGYINKKEHIEEPLEESKGENMKSNLTYYNNSVFGSIDSNMIYTITTKSIFKIKLKSAVEYLQDIYCKNDFIKYLHTSLSILNDTMLLLHGIPENEIERYQMFMPKINENILAYIGSTNFKGIKGKNDVINEGMMNIDSNEDNINVKRKSITSSPTGGISTSQIQENNSDECLDEVIKTINAIIDFESFVKDFKTLFVDIKHALEKKNCLDLFLSQLEPFVFCDKITKIPDNVLKELTKFYCGLIIPIEASKHPIIQKLLTKLDLSESDPLFLNTLCLEFDLDAALFYISAKFGHNFAFPFIKLLNDIKILLEPLSIKLIKRNSAPVTSIDFNTNSMAAENSHEIEENNKKLAIDLGYKALWYLRSCLKKTIYFYDNQIDDELWFSIAHQIKLIFFEETNLRSLLKIDPYITLNLTLLYFFGELNDIAEGEHMKIYNTVIDFFSESGINNNNMIMIDNNKNDKGIMFEIFMTGKLIESGYSSLIDENTIYKILVAYWSDPMSIEDKLFILYYKIMLPYINENNEITDVIHELKTNITTEFIQKERDKFSEIFVKNCRNILDKNKILNLLNILHKSNINQADLIKNELLLMDYVVDKIEKINNIDEDILVLYIEMLSLIGTKKHKKKVLAVLKRFAYYPINNMILICKHFNVKDAWAYLESRNGNFDQSLVLSYEAFCRKVKKYYEISKSHDWKRTHDKLKSKLENILENLKLITYDYKEFWFEYLHKLFIALKIKRTYENNNADETREFLKIQDSVLDEIINGIIDSVSVKEIVENIRGKYADMPLELTRKLLIKLMAHYLYEGKTHKGFSGLIISDYANLTKTYYELIIQGLTINPICTSCSNPIVNGQVTTIFFCGHTFHAGTCLQQNYCPSCYKSELNVLTNIMVTINSRTNRAFQRFKAALSDLGSSDSLMKQSMIMNKISLMKKDDRNRKINSLNDFEYIRQRQNIGTAIKTNRWLDFNPDKIKKVSSFIQF